MVSARMVLTLIICKVFFSGKVFDVIFSLFHGVRNPEKSHLHGPGSLTLDGVVGYADGSRIVAIYGYGGLRMAHFFEGNAKNGRLFAIEEQGAEFGFGCGSHDEAQNRS
jgi:hypothetical protein